MFFVESLCDDPKVIESNIKEVKVNSPDYKNVDSDKAIDDFVERIHFYEMQYEPIDEKLDKHYSFIKSIYLFFESEICLILFKLFS